jgi:hypothetical protein
MSIRTICPGPGPKPKIKVESYMSPSGPKVMAVGKVKPDATVCNEPEDLIRKTFPVPGVGLGLPGVFSRM